MPPAQLFKAGVGGRREAVEPHDTRDLPRVADAIHVGSPGDVTLVREDGVRVCVVRAPAGTLIPWRTRRVLAGGTTAGALHAHYHLDPDAEK